MPEGDGAGLTAGSQPDAEVSDQCGLVSEADQFRASESWSGSRLMLVSWPGEASRPLASSIFGRTGVSAGLGSLRPSE
jgi:hypothetical protein